MNRIIRLLAGLFCLTVLAERDPFWPIDYVPSDGTPTPVPEAPDAPPPGLSPEELRAQKEREIKEALNRKATVIKDGKVFALVNGKLVSQGDTLPVRSNKQTFLLRVKVLTEDNIVLEPIED
jgi:hypothetical protein